MLTLFCGGRGGGVNLCSSLWNRNVFSLNTFERSFYFIYLVSCCITISVVSFISHSYYRAHEQYGFCQAGTSSAIFDDILVMGSPGPMAWIGAVFVVGVSDDYFSRDKVTYQSPVTEPTAPVNKYSYLGRLLSDLKDFFFVFNLIISLMNLTCPVVN